MTDICACGGVIFHYRSEQIVRLSRFRQSVPIMEDNREVRTTGSICVRRNIHQVKEGIVFFHFQYYLQLSLDKLRSFVV